MQASGIILWMVLVTVVLKPTSTSLKKLKPLTTAQIFKTSSSLAFKVGNTSKLAWCVSKR